MRIIEVLDLVKDRPIAEIAKDYLTIGEKTARQALKQAGCYSIVGKAGWFFDDSENPENLHKSIYEFADQVKKQKEGLIKEAANLRSFEGAEESFIPRKRHSFDLDVRLVKELKLKCVKEDITLYEAVEDAIRAYLERDNDEDGKAL